MKRIVKAVAIVLGVLVVLAVGAGLFLHHRVAASRPLLEGEVLLPGLSSPVTIERDALGVPTVFGATQLDVARGLGFLHAQERFFQMDLLRRRAAGELAELIGPAVLDADRAARPHGMRGVARRVLESGRSEERALLEAYTAGVNAGLTTLREKPFEYLLLSVEPAPWKPEDSVLAVQAMFFELNDERGGGESALGLLHDLYPRDVADFLAPRGGEWDAPIEGAPFAVPAIPGADRLDLRREPEVEPLRTSAQLPREEDFAGSNNWAVAGSRTAHGGALLADDMHLGIAVPNTWYRALLVWPDHRVVGITLPGTPAVTVGTNSHVAWGFTNSFGDWIDLVIVEPDPTDPEKYLTPEGPRAFSKHTEMLNVRGQAPVALEVVSTVWGPVIGRDHRGRARSSRWTAHFPEATNLDIVDLESARTVDEAVAIANRSGIPPQNFVCADEAGHIAWTIIGKIPKRVGFDGLVPTSWADGTHRWDGWLAPDDYPRIVNPPSGLLWTANARVVDGDMLSKIGDGGYALGARAKQIRDDLMGLEKPDEKAMLSVQLDDRAVFLERWRALLLEELEADAVARSPDRAEFRRLLLESWTGRASLDSVGHRLVKATRTEIFRDLYSQLAARAVAADRNFQVGDIRQWEGPLFALLKERPPHLLPRRYARWEDLVPAAVDRVIEVLRRTGPLAERTWGERNRTLFQHPMSRALPILSRFLDLPRLSLPGDGDMPRAQSVGAGASERLVVSPGREASGIFHMPGGQSGHPLSPHYRAGHDAWAKGAPTPLLPGEKVSVLTLKPSS